VPTSLRCLSVVWFAARRPGGCDRPLPADVDVDLALDLLAAQLYWRIVASAAATAAYLDTRTGMVLAALGARVS
jgi:hypothetical protein